MADTNIDSVVLFDELPASNNYKLARATLNIPATLNALTTDCVELLLLQLTTWATDDSIACVVIDGSGEKAFCAGGDVQALHASAVATPGGPCIDAENFFAREYRMNHLLHTYNKPIIVWGDGIVMGGGLGIFAGGSHRVVTETSRFAMPEVTIGLYPDVGGSYFLNRMPKSTGRFLALTGASFNAADAVYTGIANYFISRNSFQSVLDQLLIAAPTGHDQVTSLLSQFQAQSKSALPAANVEPHSEIIESLVGEQTIQQVMQNFAALQTDDKWLAKAKRSIEHGSPLSVLLIDKQLSVCADFSIGECFQAELVLSTNIVRYPEFAEGVRALLIDKDRNPQWQFSAIDKVSTDLLDAFFVAPWQDNLLNDLI